MSKRKLMLVTIIGIVVSLVQANWWGVGAQQQGAPKPPPPPPSPNVIVERDVLIDAPEMAEPPEVVIAPDGGEPTMAFISSEMAFDASPVKNAPYSAEAVTESTQILGDGNRIVRKTTASVYRDSAGRTRREQALNAAGPFATAGDVPQTVFINDTVAGVNYVLDPRTRTARKLIWPPLRVPAPPAAPLPPEAPEAAVAPAAPTAPAATKTVGVRVRRPLAAGAVRKVEPVYPPAAKAAGAQGLVKVEIATNDVGEVVSATPLEGHALLQPAAVAAVKQWRFKPVSVAGLRPAQAKSVVSFNFVLPPSGGEAIYIEEGNVLAAAPSGGAVNESLGKQTIEGVEAEGTRSTFTIPEGAIGNELPIKIVSERWYSPELQTVVMTKRSDPRFGETIYRLTNINRGEPANSLFEVPADYTLKEAGGIRRTMKRIRQ